MADAGEGLSAGAVANPRLWRLGMELDMDGATLAVAAASSVGEEEMLVRRIGLASGIAPLRALEDAVYDNPMLLADFDRTTILLRTPRFSVVPSELAEDADAVADAAALLWTSADERPRLFISPVAGTDASVLTACDADVAAFIGRTFADAKVEHALVPLMAYFAAKAPRCGDSAKVFAVVSSVGADLIVFDENSRLRGATSYVCASPDDMSYYAAAMAQVCGVASPELSFYVAGEAAVRDSVMDSLRRFAPNVMPWVMPAGQDVPFSLLEVV